MKTADISCALFNGLLDDDLAYLASRCGAASYGNGERIFSKGEKAIRFFIVRSGSVSIIAGKDTEIARYVEGDVFGDFHFVISGVYDATAIARDGAELTLFPAQGITFEKIADEKPDTASRIMLKSLSMIASRLKTTQALIEENKPWIRELRKQIFTDPPTGLWNKTFMDSELPSLIQGSVTLIMTKPDRFKELNDELGHAKGDEILADIASLLLALASRLKGWAIRLRSNEMCLIIPYGDALKAEKLARKIASSFPSIHEKLTASMALGYWPDSNLSLQKKSDRINERLQDVWKSGGGRIELEAH